MKLSLYSGKLNRFLQKVLLWWRVEIQNARLLWWIHFSSWWFFIKSFNTQLDYEKDWDENKYSNHNIQEHQRCHFPFQNMFVCVFFTGQLISKANILVLIWTKNWTKLFLISALASTNGSNQKKIFIRGYLT